MTLPSNKTLECQFIGQSILDGRISTRELTTGEFYDESYRAAWAAICELDEENHEIETISIHKIASKIGLSLSVAELNQTAIGLIYMNGSKPKHIQELKNLALRRLLIRELSAGAAQLHDADDLSETLENIDAKLNEIRTGLGTKNGFTALSEIIDSEVKPALQDLKHGQTKKISTGFAKLDKSIGGGLVPSDVVLIVSDTGNGKSAFVLQLADQIAQQGIGVAYTSGEMRNCENGLRLLSQNAKVTNLNSVVHLAESTVDHLNEWADHIKTRPIYFDHESGDLQSVKKNLKLLMMREKIGIVILDYIQLYKLTKNDKLGRVERLTELSQEVKRMANELGVCVIEVAQFNREGMKSKQPTMHDLEGSGQFEKDTSLIFIIDRLGGEQIDLRIVKGRNAGLCNVSGTFIGKELRFEL